MKIKNITLKLLFTALCATSVAPAIKADSAIDWAQNNPKKTIISIAIAWKIIDHYLTERGNTLVDSPEILQKRSNLRKLIERVIGYRIKTKRKIKEIIELKDGRKIERDAKEIIKTDLESRGLGWIMDLIEWPFEDNFILKECHDAVKNAEYLGNLIS